MNDQYLNEWGIRFLFLSQESAEEALTLLCRANAAVGGVLDNDRWTARLVPDRVRAQMDELYG